MVLFPGIWTCTRSGLVWQVLGTDFLPFFCVSCIADSLVWEVGVGQPQVEGGF